MFYLLLNYVRPSVPSPRIGARAHNLARGLICDASTLLIEGGGILRRNPLRVILVAFTAAAVVMFALVPSESEWLEWVSAFRKSAAGQQFSKAAWVLSEYGDFLGLNGLVFAGLSATAILRGSHLFRLVVLASLLGTTLSGGTANVMRVMLGRARPNAPVEPGFYGPRLSARYHSCPSGHTATAFGGSIPVAVAVPQIGVPLMAVAGCVAWSRFHNRAHHPSDILISITLAGIFGVPLGMAARRAAKRGVNPRLRRERR